MGVRRPARDLLSDDRTRLLLAVLGGVVFGVVDRIVGHGPPWAFDLSNVGAFWLAAAFLAGMATRTRALGAVAGLVGLFGALFGYYGYMYFVEHVTLLSYLEWRAAPWILAAAVVGPLFGALGSEWSSRRSTAPVVVLAAAFWLDGLGFAAVYRPTDVSNIVVHGAVAALGIVGGLAFLELRRQPPARSSR